MDVAIAHSLQKLAIIKQQYESKQAKLDVEQNIQRIRPQTIAIFYLFNPFTILSCVSKSSIIFTNLSVVMATLWASLGNTRTLSLKVSTTNETQAMHPCPWYGWRLHPT